MTLVAKVSTGMSYDLRTNGLCSKVKDELRVRVHYELSHGFIVSNVTSMVCAQL